MTGVARFFPLRLDGDHARLRLRVPSSLYRVRGVVLMTTMSLPLAILALAGETAPSGGFLLFVAFSVAGIVAFALHVAFARRWSRRTEILFDRAEGTVRRATSEVGVDLRLAAAVRLRNRNRLDGYWAIDLVRIDGTVLMVLHDRLPAYYGREMAFVVEAIGAWLRDGTEVPDALRER